MGTRAAVGWAGRTLSAIARHPFANRARTNAYGFAHRLRRLPACNLPDNPLSTTRRKAGILMDVHPALLGRLLKLRQLQLPRPGPDGQPIESSQLVLAEWRKCSESGDFHQNYGCQH